MDRVACELPLLTQVACKAARCQGPEKVGLAVGREQNCSCRKTS